VRGHTRWNVSVFHRALQQVLQRASTGSLTNPSLEHGADDLLKNLATSGQGHFWVHLSNRRCALDPLRKSAMRPGRSDGAGGGSV
jgi:hypothetical protein